MRTTSQGGAARAMALCLHSSGATGRQWQPLAARLDATMRVVAPDLHGHGEGPAWTDARSDILRADAELVVALARDWTGPVHLVGHSWGAAVALRAARLSPQRFASVAAYEPVLFRLLRNRGERDSVAGRAAAIGRALRADLRAGARRMAARRFVDFWNGAGSFDALAPMRQDALAARMPAVGAHFRALWNDEGLDAYRALPMPVRLFVGAQTHAATRLIAEIVATALPHARVHRLTAMGHMGPVTHPNTVAQSMATFVTAQSGTGAVEPVARAA